jgi:hypothetical protein
VQESQVIQSKNLRSVSARISVQSVRESRVSQSKNLKSVSALDCIPLTFAIRLGIDTQGLT